MEKGRVKEIAKVKELILCQGKHSYGISGLELYKKIQGGESLIYSMPQFEDKGKVLKNGETEVLLRKDDFFSVSQKKFETLQNFPQEPFLSLEKLLFSAYFRSL